MLRRPALLLALLLALSGAAACSGAVDQEALQKASGQLPGIEVSGAVGEPPIVRIQAPLELEETRSRTVVPGTGAPLYLDRVFVLQLTMYDGRTGRKAVSTYDEGRTPLAVTDGAATLFPALTQALVGLDQGSRIVLAATAADTFGEAGAPQYGIRPGDPVVVIADVVAVPPRQVLSGPSGSPRTAPVDLPSVHLDPDGTPDGVRFERQGTPLAKPDHLVVVPLIEGDGPAAGAPGLVTLDYLGQVWGSPQPFADTWTKEPVTVPLGVDGVVPAWDRALAGVRRGSRVLLVVPPALGYGATGNPPAIPGNATLVYVIDVLGVS